MTNAVFTPKNISSWFVLRASTILAVGYEEVPRKSEHKQKKAGFYFTQLLYPVRMLFTVINVLNPNISIRK